MSGLKIIFIKMKSFIMDKRKSLKMSILNSLDVMLGSILLDIWVSQCIIHSSVILIGGKSKNILKRS